MVIFVWKLLTCPQILGPRTIKYFWGALIKKTPVLHGWFLVQKSFYGKRIALYPCNRSITVITSKYKNSIWTIFRHIQIWEEADFFFNLAIIANISCETSFFEKLFLLFYGLSLWHLHRFFGLSRQFSKST